MSLNSCLFVDFLLGLNENQLKGDGYLYTPGNYTKTSIKTGHENMFNQKLKRDCGHARNAQGSPKAGARTIFVQKKLAQSPYTYNDPQYGAFLSHGATPSHPPFSWGIPS